MFQLTHIFKGCGKTSFIKALAGHLNFDICVLNLAEADLTDLALAKKLSQVPEKSILLLEDVDAAFTSRSEATDSNKLQSPSHLASGIISQNMMNHNRGLTEPLLATEIRMLSTHNSGQIQIH